MEYLKFITALLMCLTAMLKMRRSAQSHVSESKKAMPAEMPQRKTGIIISKIKVLKRRLFDVWLELIILSIAFILLSCFLWLPDSGPATRQDVVQVVMLAVIIITLLVRPT